MDPDKYGNICPVWSFEYMSKWIILGKNFLVHVIHPNLSAQDTYIYYLVHNMTSFSTTWTANPKCEGLKWPPLNKHRYQSLHQVCYLDSTWKKSYSFASIDIASCSSIFIWLINWLHYSLRSTTALSHQVLSWAWLTTFCSRHTCFIACSRSSPRSSLISSTSSAASDLSWTVLWIMDLYWCVGAASSPGQWATSKSIPPLDVACWACEAKEASRSSVT